MQTYLKTPLSDNGEIKIPAKMSLYNGMKIDKPDQYLVETGGFLTESNVLLVNEQLELCGLLNLRKDDQYPNRYFLAADQAIGIRQTKNKNYSFIF